MVKAEGGKHQPECASTSTSGPNFLSDNGKAPFHLSDVSWRVAADKMDLWGMRTVSPEQSGSNPFYQKNNPAKVTVKPNPAASTLD